MPQLRKRGSSGLRRKGNENQSASDSQRGIPLARRPGRKYAGDAAAALIRHQLGDYPRRSLRPVLDESERIVPPLGTDASRSLIIGFSMQN
jgi:hypothetical protein